MRVRALLKMSRLCGHSKWRYVLIQAKKVPGIIFRFNRNESIPALAIRFVRAVVLVLAHEIDVHARCHGRAKLRKKLANLGDVGSVLCRAEPIAEQVNDKWGATVTEGGFVRADSSSGASQICEFDLSHGRGDRRRGLNHRIYAAVLEFPKIAGFSVIAPAMREL